METVIWFLIWGVLIFFMMRGSAAAHMSWGTDTGNMRAVVRRAIEIAYVGRLPRQTSIQYAA